MQPGALHGALYGALMVCSLVTVRGTVWVLHGALMVCSLGLAKQVLQSLAKMHAHYMGRAPQVATSSRPPAASSSQIGCRPSGMIGLGLTSERWSGCWPFRRCLTLMAFIELLLAAWLLGCLLKSDCSPATHQLLTGLSGHQLLTSYLLG